MDCINAKKYEHRRTGFKSGKARMMFTYESVQTTTLSREAEVITSKSLSTGVRPKGLFHQGGAELTAEISDTNGSSAKADVGTYELIPEPKASPVREFFTALQKWECYVLAVKGDTFLARLHPLLGEGLDQEAEIYLEEVSEEDRPLIQLGAVFYWSIGYLERPSGRLRSSVIKFRRLPTWTNHDLGEAKKEIGRLRGLFDSGDSAQCPVSRAI